MIHFKKDHHKDLKKNQIKPNLIIPTFPEEREGEETKLKKNKTNVYLGYFYH